jgi:hypothetical protein
MTENPSTAACSIGKRVDALRRKYREYLWDAEFRDTVGAALKVVGRPAGQEDGDEARSCLHYSVFRQLRSGSRAVVVANHHESESMQVRVEADPPLRHPALVSPEEPDPASAAAPITIPPRSVVVLLEDYGR